MNALPDLPKEMQKREADFGLEFREWWEKNPMNGNFELKHTRGKDALSFSAVEPKQVRIAQRASDRVLLRLVRATTGSPDYIGQVEQDTFIVIRYPAFFCLVPFYLFNNERIVSKRKSLTSVRAKEISSVIIKK